MKNLIIFRISIIFCLTAIGCTESTKSTGSKKANNITAENQNSIPLINAIKSRNSKDVKKLLLNGANPNSRDTNGNTALMIAVEVAFLPVKKANQEDYSSLGSQYRTAAEGMAAAASDDGNNSFYTLLDFNADIDAKNNYGGTVLITVVSAGRPDFLELLLKKGIDPHVIDDYNRNAMNYLIMSADESYHYSSKYKEIFELLIKANVNVNLRDKFGETPLKIAIEDELSYYVKRLKEEGAKE